MGLIAKLLFSDLVEILPTIPGKFSRVVPPRTFEEKMRGQCFWSFNEKNKDLYFSFGSPKYGEKLCSHILDGKPKMPQSDIYWDASQGLFISGRGDSSENYLTPVGWHQGLFLMRNDYLDVYEVLITEEREAECRENHNIVYEAIEIIRKKHELMRSGQILSSEKKKRFWLPYIITELVLLAIIILPCYIIPDKIGIIGILISFCPLGMWGTLIIAIHKYKVFKARARADFFDEI